MLRKKKFIFTKNYIKMKKVVSILVLSIFVLTSCKNNKKDEDIKQEKPFTIEMNVTIKEDDVICIYYKDLSVGYFGEQMGIYKNLVKSNKSQNIVFEVEEGIIPNDFRFDLSHQNKNQTMLVNKIVFNFANKSFEILNKDLDKYFTPNKGIVFNETDRSYNFKNNEDGSYDPFLSSTGEFYPLLEKLVGYEAFAKPVQ